MNKAHLILSFLLMPGLGACTQINAIPRDKLTANINPILMVEQRADQVRTNTQLLGLIGGIPSDKAKELKSHYDVYYVHYLAASVNLAGGDIDTYRTHLKLAERELEAMETLLSNNQAQPREPNPGKKEALSPPSLL